LNQLPVQEHKHTSTNNEQAGASKQAGGIRRDRLVATGGNAAKGAFILR